MLKKIGALLSVTGIMVLGMATSAFAAVTVDKEAVADGIVSISHDEAGKTLKVIVDKEGVKYQYDVPEKVETNIPLQMGAGNYTIQIAESVGGNSYKLLSSETVTVGEVDETVMYTQSIQYINFNGEMVCMTELTEMTAEMTDINEKIATVYKFVTENFTYDFDKIPNLPANYVPSIEEVYEARKGICYDYSSLFAAALRSAGIPTKLQMGYAKGINEYHAWNEILIGETWCKVDTTYDSQAFKAEASYEMVKPQEDFQVVKEY